MLSHTNTIHFTPSSFFPVKTLLFPSKPINYSLPTKIYKLKMSSFGGFCVRAQMGSNNEQKTLIEYVGKCGINVGNDLVILIDHLQYACKKISALLSSPFNSSIGKFVGGSEKDSGSGRDAPKPLDIVSNEIILSSLQSSGKVAVFASEENEAPVYLTDDGPFVVVVDPLDGSRNIDASIPTGTIFGIYNRLVELDNLPVEEKATLNSLQSGTRLVASGYVLYSSATIFCVTFGSGVCAFTLDHSTGDFILTNPSIQIPLRVMVRTLRYRCVTVVI